ncbi:MAG: hypothetical protein ACK4K0_12285 [Flavobacteriales bacterium]
MWLIKILISCISLMLLFNVNGQSVAKVNKTIDSKSFVLEEFEYTLRKGDTIKNGKYYIELFQSLSEEEAHTFKKNASILNLNYKNGELDGAVFSNRLHFNLSEGNQTVNNYFLSNPIDGISYELSGNFKANKPVGEWTVVGKNIKNAKVIGEFKVLAIMFNSKGEYQKDFIYDSNKNSVKINGKFGKNNLLHGKWEYVYSEDNRKKIHFNFDEGLITSILYNEESIFEQEDTVGDFEELDLDSTFYHYVTLRLKKSEKDLSAKLEGVLDFVSTLKRSISYLVFQNLELGEFSPEILEVNLPKVRYPLHPFKTNEEARIDGLRLKAETMCRQMDSLLQSPVFTIYVLTDSVLTRKSIALGLLKSHTEVVRDFAVMLDIPVSKYIDREKYANFIRNRLRNVPVEKNYIFGGVASSIKVDIDAVSSGADYTKDMTEYLNSIDFTYNRLLQVINARLSEVKVTSELVEQERRMIKLADEVEEKVYLRFTALFDSDLDKPFQDAFIGFKNKILHTYSSYDEAKKNNRGEEMLKCLERMNELIEKTAIIKQRRLIIHGAYNKEEMNHVTYTKMDIILHERLYNAYTQKLLPWAVQELNNNATYDCERFIRKFNNILAIQQYMIDVLENNPSKVNRKLRSKDSVSDILRKLELQLQ